MRGLPPKISSVFCWIGSILHFWVHWRGPIPRAAIIVFAEGWNIRIRTVAASLDTGSVPGVLIQIAGANPFDWDVQFQGLQAVQMLIYVGGFPPGRQKLPLPA